MAKQAFLGSKHSHGGTITSASPNVTVNGKPVARKGDTASCPTHGTVTIVGGSSKVLANGRARARIGDALSCGAVIVDGSSNQDVGD